MASETYGSNTLAPGYSLMLGGVSFDVASATLALVAALGRRDVSQCQTLIKRLRDLGDGDAIAILAPLLVGAQDEDIERAVVRAISTLFDGAPIQRLIDIDQQIRSPLQPRFDLRTRGAWLALEPTRLDSALSDDGLDIVRLAVFASHPLGHVREAAVERLSSMRPSGLRYLLIRASDWVRPVRVAATNAVMQSLHAETAAEVIACLPLVLRLASSCRVSRPLINNVLAFVAEQPEDILAPFLNSCVTQPRVYDFEHISISSPRIG